MNYKKCNKVSKWDRICVELTQDQDDVDEHDPEAGADLRFAIILLRRAIRSLTGASNSEG